MSISDMQARLVATLALTQDATLLEMARDMRDMASSRSLPRTTNFAIRES